MNVFAFNIFEEYLFYVSIINTLLYIFLNNDQESLATIIIPFFLFNSYFVKYKVILHCGFCYYLLGG